MKYWAVIPAAGIGSRMQAEIPKQYLQIAGKSILEHTLEQFIQHPKVAGIVVAISEDDQQWKRLQIVSEKPLLVAKGGAERCHSVLSSLKTLETHADQADWALVHDAARPCLRSEDIDSLIDQLEDHPVGGLLAAPVKDTMKRSCETDPTVLETVERTNLWHALTPQMFRIADLRLALENALEKGLVVTDEAQAMELMGKMPLLVEGYMDNIKITRPQDLELAEHYMRARES